MVGWRLHHLDLNDVGLFRMEITSTAAFSARGPARDGLGQPHHLVHSFLISTSASLALRFAPPPTASRLDVARPLTFDLRVMTTLIIASSWPSRPNLWAAQLGQLFLYACPRRSRPCHSELVRRPTSQRLCSACRELETSVRLTSVRLSSSASGRRRAARGTRWASRVAVALYRCARPPRGRPPRACGDRLLEVVHHLQGGAATLRMASSIERDVLQEASYVCAHRVLTAPHHSSTVRF
jgi:hypothetical protein